MSKLSKIIKAELEAVDRRALDADIEDAVNAALLAVDEYYHGDRAWAVGWMTRAYVANKEKP